MTIFIFLGALLAVMALGVPIAYALLLSGVALMWHLDMFDAQILAQNVINGADSFPLLAVPFFMLAGEIMNVGGLSRRIVNLALTLVGHRRGGLGFVAIVAACLLAALSGSAVADTAALASLLLPMMVAAGHDKARAGGLIASAGIIAPVIPPSIGFVVFGVAANVSISKLFLAGIVPGLMMGLSIAAAWWWVSKKENIQPPAKATTAQRLKALRESTWALVLPIIVVVGLKFGVFTPTEAAVVAVQCGEEGQRRAPQRPKGELCGGLCGRLKEARVQHIRVGEGIGRQARQHGGVCQALNDDARALAARGVGAGQVKVPKGQVVWAHAVHLREAGAPLRHMVQAPLAGVEDGGGARGIDGCRKVGGIAQ
jgi:TRAP-type uncharacterized transport system fused permease subunit